MPTAPAVGGRDTFAAFDRVVDELRSIETDVIAHADCDHPLAGVVDPRRSRAILAGSWDRLLTSRRSRKADMAEVGRAAVTAGAWALKVAADMAVIEGGHAGAVFRVLDSARGEAVAPTPIDGLDRGDTPLPKDVLLRLHHVWQSFLSAHVLYCERRCDPEEAITAAVRLGGRLAWAAAVLPALCAPPPTADEDDD